LHSKYLMNTRKSLSKLNSEVKIEMSGNIKEVEVKVLYAVCPICGIRVYGLSEGEVHRKLVEHMDRMHYKIIPHIKWVRRVEA